MSLPLLRCCSHCPLPCSCPCPFPFLLLLTKFLLVFSFVLILALVPDLSLVLVLVSVVVLTLTLFVAHVFFIFFLFFFLLSLFILFACLIVCVLLFMTILVFIDVPTPAILLAFVCSCSNRPCISLLVAELPLVAAQMLFTLLMYTRFWAPPLLSVHFTRGPFSGSGNSAHLGQPLLYLSCLTCCL